jgi:replicative DNA helicase
MQLRHGLDFIVLDYIGMVDDDYGKNQYERIGYISRKLKQIAMTLNVPILAAHQLNRALEIRNDKRPELFDLRDSGRLEEDADVVLFLYREDYYFTAEEWAIEYPGGNNIYSTYPQGIVEVIVAKQRQGQSNMAIKVLYDKNHQVYQNLTMSQA